MPELPEMQALAERLDAAFRGQRLVDVTPLQFSALKTVSPPVESVLADELSGVGRRGKYLLFSFEGAHVAVHLSQGGRIDLERPAKRTRPRGAVVRFSFEREGSILVKEFGSERRAAWWVLGPDDDGPMGALGPEPFSDAFAELVRTSSDRRRVHTLLRDQRTVAGIGRGYADDVLHRARLSPFASLGSLSVDERSALLDAVHEVLEAALAEERTRGGGLPPKLGDHFAVHNRYGQPCPRCGDDLRRVSYETHEVTYCPACQTEGKVLADRRLSRIVR